MNEKKRLYKSATSKKISGVCGGVAEYLDLDPTIVRIVWALVSLLWGTGIILYIIAAFVMDENPNPSSGYQAAEHTDAAADTDNTASSGTADDPDAAEIYANEEENNSEPDESALEESES